MIGITSCPIDTNFRGFSRDELSSIFDFYVKSSEHPVYYDWCPWKSPFVARNVPASAISKLVAAIIFFDADEPVVKPNADGTFTVSTRGYQAW